MYSSSTIRPSTLHWSLPRPGSWSVLGLKAYPYHIFAWDCVKSQLKVPLTLIPHQPGSRLRPFRSLPGFHLMHEKHCRSFVTLGSGFPFFLQDLPCCMLLHSQLIGLCPATLGSFSESPQPATSWCSRGWGWVLQSAVYRLLLSRWPMIIEMA